MRICFVCCGFSYIYGGVETVIYKLSEQWAKQGHEVYILSGKGKKAGPKGVRVIKLPFIPLKFFEIMPLITKIFWASEFEGLSLLPFAIICLFGIKPNIVLSNQLSENLPARILRIPAIMISQAPIRIRFNTFKKVKSVIVNDAHSYKILKKYGIRTDFILNGIDKQNNLKNNLNDLRVKLNISKKSKVILSVARLDSNKRINLLIDAFKLIKQNATLIIVGEGSELAKLKKQASLIKSDNKIFFVKPMPHEKLMELYQLCDVFTLPSKFESFGLVFLEALSFGKPIVTNPSPEKKLLLGKFGIFSNVEDPQGYSESLLEAFSRIINVNSHDYKSYMQKFYWTNIANEYTTVFYDILNSNLQNIYNKRDENE